MTWPGPPCLAPAAPRRGLWAPDPEGVLGPCPPLQLVGRVRICLVNGLNTLPPVSCPLSSHRSCPAAPFINPPTNCSLKGFF